MKPSVLRAWPILGVAVLSFGIASSAQAQDTTRVRSSQQRIPISKRESRGEVDLNRMRADSIARADSLARARMEQARLDSIAAIERRRADSVAAAEKARADSIAAVERARADSIAAVERARADSIARADSLARAEQERRAAMNNRYLFNGSGWYLGVSGGRSSPMDDFDTIGYETGFNITVPIGWHKPNYLFGVRFDFGFDKFNTEPVAALASDSDPRVLSAAANLTMRLPLGSSRFALYGVGGGGIYNFSGYGTGSPLSGFLGNDILDNNDENDEKSITKFGANLGAGIELGFGPAAIFLESRWVNVFANRDEDIDLDEFIGSTAKHLRWMPLVLGISFR